MTTNNPKIRQLWQQAGITDNNLSDGNITDNQMFKFADLLINYLDSLDQDQPFGQGMN